MADVTTLQQENRRLENLYSREKDTLENRIQNFEEDMEAALAEVESKAAAAARSQLEQEKRGLDRKMEAERNRLQSHFNLYNKIDAWLSHEEKERRRLVEQTQRDLKNVQQENKGLRENLFDAQGNIALLHAQLARLRSEYEDKCRQLVEKETEVDERVTEEEQLMRQMRVIREASQKLQDTNDSLLGFVDSKFNRTSRLLTPAVHHGKAASQKWRTSSLRYKKKVKPCSTLRREAAHSEGSSCCESCLDFACHPAPARPRSLMNSAAGNHSDVVMSASYHFGIERYMNDPDSGRSTMRDSVEHDSELPSIALLDPVVGINSTPSSSDSEEDVLDPPCVMGPPSLSSEMEAAERVDVWGAGGQRAIAASSPGRLPTARGPQVAEIRNTYKVVLCGDSSVGKSSFIAAVCKGYFVHNTPSTLGVDFQVKVMLVDDEAVAVQLWDTAGQEKFRCITKSYFRRADGVILMYDVTAEQSFLSVRSWVHDVQDAAGEGVPIILCGNKVDKRADCEIHGKRVVGFKEGSRLAAEIGSIFIETSAKSGTHLNETLLSLCREMGARHLEEKRLGSTLGQADPAAQAKKSSCCSSGGKR